jgi:hypothetical protein
MRSRTSTAFHRVGLALSVPLFLGSAFFAYSQVAEPSCPASGVWNKCIGTKGLPNGEKYEGEFRDGKANGQGTYTWPDGDRYVGEFRDGKANGQGTYTSADGRRYVGEWRDDEKEGQGTYTWPNGEKYEGEFRDGYMTGQGTSTWPDGRKYVGEWKDDKFNGSGTYTWLTGKTYVGEWTEGKSNRGTYSWPDGTKYVGEWTNDPRKLELLSWPDPPGIIKIRKNAVTYEQLVREPQDYIGATITIKGLAVQSLDEGADAMVRVNVTPDTNFKFFRDTVYVDFHRPYPPGKRILENDVVQFTGEFVGIKSYQAVSGATIQMIPWIKCNSGLLLQSAADRAAR